MWTVTGRFTVIGYQTREIDLTPALGIGFIVFTAYLMLLNTGA